MGQKRRFGRAPIISISDLGAFLNEVSSTPGNGHHAARSRGPKSADSVEKVSLG